MPSHKIPEDLVFAARASKEVRVSARVSMGARVVSVSQGIDEVRELGTDSCNARLERGGAFSVWTSKVVRIGFEGRDLDDGGLESVFTRDSSSTTEKTRKLDLEGARGPEREACFSTSLERGAVPARA